MKKLIMIPLLSLSLFLMGCNLTIMPDTSPEETEPEALPPPSPPPMEEQTEERAETSIPMTRTITVDAKRFEFTPSVIRVKAEETTILRVNSLDTTHTISIPELGLNGAEVMIEDAPKGTYEFRCSTYCGIGHGDMKGTLIVE